MSADRIFVQIAAYKDKDVFETIRSLHDQAVDPESVHVGVCLQGDAADLDAWEAFIRNYRFAHAVKCTYLPIEEARGANHARAVAQRLLTDETYILQIDSHHRFVPAWDSRLIRQHESMGTGPHALTSFLPGFTGVGDLQRVNLQRLKTRIRCRAFAPAGSPQLIHLSGELVPRSQGVLQPCPFLVANFLFARAEIFRRIPLDPNFRFYGDEISLSLRFWTHGINIFQLDDVVAYHRWSDPDAKLKPYKVESARTWQVDYARLMVLFGESDSSVELGAFGLGKQRAIEDFFNYAGIDLTARTMSDCARTGAWTAEFLKDVGGSVSRTDAIAQSPGSITSVMEDPVTEHTLTLGHEWKHWIQDNKAAGCSEQSLLACLTGSGWSAEDALGAISSSGQRPSDNFGVESRGEPSLAVIEVNPFAPRPFVFTDLAFSFVESFKARGLGARRLTDVSQCSDGEALIVLGWGEEWLSINRQYLENRQVWLFNAEQLGSGSKLVTKGFLQACNEFNVIDYHDDNLRCLEKTSSARPRIVVPVIPQPALVYADKVRSVAFPWKERPTDVLLFGSKSARRQKIIEKLRGHGLIVEAISGSYGWELTPAIQKAKLVLHVHYYETRLFPAIRFLQPVVQGVPIVCETSVFSTVNNWSDSGMVFADYDNLVETCRWLLASEAQAAAGAYSCLDFVKRMTMPDITRLPSVG